MDAPATASGPTAVAVNAGVLSDGLSAFFDDTLRPSSRALRGGGAACGGCRALSWRSPGRGVGFGSSPMRYAEVRRAPPGVERS